FKVRINLFINYFLDQFIYYDNTKIVNIEFINIEYYNDNMDDNMNQIIYSPPEPLRAGMPNGRQPRSILLGSQQISPTNVLIDWMLHAFALTHKQQVGRTLVANVEHKRQHKVYNTIK
ncbi:hypothetical protein ACJX0J_037383, partial [Zea mays]